MKIKEREEVEGEGLSLKKPDTRRMWKGGGAAMGRGQVTQGLGANGSWE